MESADQYIHMPTAHPAWQVLEGEALRYHIKVAIDDVPSAVLDIEKRTTFFNKIASSLGFSISPIVQTTWSEWTDQDNEEFRERKILSSIEKVSELHTGLSLSHLLDIYWPETVNALKCSLVIRIYWMYLKQFLRWSKVCYLTTTHIQQKIG